MLFYILGKVNLTVLAWNLFFEIKGRNPNLIT